MAHLGRQRAETLPTTMPGPGVDRRSIAEAPPSVAEPSVAAEAPLAAGDSLAGRFIIERELGRGGGGAVYLARDLKLDRAVAIKVLPRGPADHIALARFEREARTAGSLEHPNVLAVHDVGVHGGAPFIVSELLEGSTLRDRIAQGPLPVGEAVKLALQLAQGLAATHEKGIVHRDLKPENLFVLRDGRLKILDFGVAKLLRSGDGSGAGPPKTDANAIIGTVPYMSPEQVRGSPADARSDVFAFGAILHEMLSGRPAFKRDSEVETGHAILAEEAADISAECPPALRTLIRRCLVKDPAGRPGSASELIEVLDPLSRFPARKLARPWPLRPWALAVSAFLGAAVILVGSVPDVVRTWLYGTAPEVKRLAILPFTALGGGADGQAFTAGLHEILTSKLQQVEQFQRSLRVVSATDVLKEGVKNAAEARSAFGATLALTGTVQWDGAKVIVAANLVDTRSRLLVAARDVDASGENLSALTGVLVQKVSEMLAIELQPVAQQAVQASPPPSPAYALYLQGRGYLQRYDRIENVERAVEVFEQALVRDPRYALAHAGIAEASLRRYRATRDVSALEQARASSRRGVELQPDLAQVHFTAGLIDAVAGEHAAAIDRFRQALRIEPGNADAIRELANAYDGAGRTKDAEATFRRAVQLRPDSWAACRDLASFYNRRGRLQEALPWFQRVVALTPDSYGAYSSLAGLYLRLGRYGEAAVALQKSLALRPTTPAYINLGGIRYFEGRFEQAAEAYRKAIELTPSDERAWGSLADALRWLPAAADERVGAYKQAIALAERQAAVHPRDAELRSRLAMYRAYAGEREAADSDLREALRLGPADGAVLFRAALVHEQLGRREDALDAIARALRTGYSREEIGKAPTLETLRRDPRYAQIASTGRANGL